MAEVGDLKTYIHEPDGAAIRAGLVAHLAQRLDAAPVGERIAYLSGDRLPESNLRLNTLSVNSS